MYKKLLIYLIFIAPCFSFRDPFSFEQSIMINQPLNNMSLKDLTFIGTILSAGQVIGFVADPMGNIYQLTLGQRLGAQHSDEVINILQDRVILTDGEQYTVIK